MIDTGCLRRGSFAVLVAFVGFACGDEGRKTTRSCDTDGDCAGGVCYEQACYDACQDQDDCAADQFCVRKAGAPGATASLCVTAAEYAGCETAADCAELVAGPCQQPACDEGQGLCGLASGSEGAACDKADGGSGRCADGTCVASVEPPDATEVSPVDGVLSETTNGPIFHDLATGLMWVRADAPEALDQAGAVAWCEALALEDYDDWRLPTISELRTTIVGCAGSMPGGACPTSDPGCLTESCWSSSSCSCPLAGGPGEGGFYWEPGVWELIGGTLNFWSSSVVADSQGDAWVLFPRNGGVDYWARDNWGLVRCVRSAP